MTNNLVNLIAVDDGEDAADSIAIQAILHWVYTAWYLYRMQREISRELSLEVILCLASHLVTLHAMLQYLVNSDLVCRFRTLIQYNLGCSASAVPGVKIAHV